ncbi:MAG: hypothetical protein ACLPWS_14305 [Rhodomicrobium sp.]
MFGLRNMILQHGRQTLALCIVWGALAASVGLCLFAPANQSDSGLPETSRAAAMMISLAARGF